MKRTLMRQTTAPMFGAFVATGGSLVVGFDGVFLAFAAGVGALVGAVLLPARPEEVQLELKTVPVVDESTRPFVETPDDLPESVGTYPHLLDALPIGVLLIGTDMSVRTVNSMMRQIFGLPREAGYPIETLRARPLLEAIARVGNTGGPEVFEMTLSRGTNVMLNVHVHPVPPSETDDVALIVAVEDITTAQVADELHRDFVANASHELKTPLAVVSGLIETLQGPAKNDPIGTERFLGRLASQTRRMTRLVEDLMSLNRIELNERVLPEAPEDLARLVEETIDALRPVAEGSDVELVLHAIDDAPQVMAEREELGQLFGNLIDNAIKYGGTGKEVHIRFQRSRNDGQIGVTVEDQGPGIAREHLPRLTERFYRVDIGRSREKGGTGLGLAICKHIINRHRGRLEIESILGEGSQFTVWLPCHFKDDRVARLGRGGVQRGDSGVVEKPTIT
ncbi:MAG: ATP-binding protein [Pseudomonadota bacterium]